MKIIILLVCMVVASFCSFAQEDEYFVYCSNTLTDTLVISKVSETQFGDTIVREYAGIQNSFKYYLFNDTIFSKYQNEYVMIGANNAMIGDVWNPMWYSYHTYNTLESENNPNCPPTRSLEVIAIDTIYFNNQPHRKYSLLVLDDVPYHYYTDSIIFSFIEGIGAAVGGPYYNLFYEGNCVLMFDVPIFTFRSLSFNGTYHLEENCIGNVGLEEVTSSPIITNKGGILTVEDFHKYNEIKIIDSCGKMVLQSEKNHINTTHLKGFYFILLEDKQGGIHNIKVSL